MESNSEKNRIHMSEVSADLLAKQAPEMILEPRKSMHIKGKGKMQTYFLLVEDIDLTNSSDTTALLKAKSKKLELGNETQSPIVMKASCEPLNSAKLQATDISLNDTKDVILKSQSDIQPETNCDNITSLAAQSSVMSNMGEVEQNSPLVDSSKEVVEFVSIAQPTAARIPTASSKESVFTKKPSQTSIGHQQSYNRQGSSSCMSSSSSSIESSSIGELESNETRLRDSGNSSSGSQMLKSVDSMRLSSSNLKPHSSKNDENITSAYKPTLRKLPFPVTSSKLSKCSGTDDHDNRHVSISNILDFAPSPRTSNDYDTRQNIGSSQHNLRIMPDFPEDNEMISYSEMV